MVPLATEGKLRAMSNDWLIWQLADSAFPSGGFAHSAGLEAAHQHGVVTDGNSLADFIASSLKQQNHGVLRFAVETWTDPQTFEQVDRQCDLFLNNSVSNNASRAQGRAFLLSAAGTFERPGIRLLMQKVREQRFPGHFAPAFGVVAKEMELDQNQMRSLFCFIVLRGIVSAAVRLGIVGPLEGQQIQARLSKENPSIGAVSDEAVQISPVLDLIQGTQDRLYSRLFQS